MKRTAIKAASLILTVLALSGISACSKHEDKPAAGAEIKEYVVGTGATYAPFEYENEHKELVGFDIDVMKAIAQKEGMQVKFINTPFDGIFTALAQGDRDIIMSGLTITEKRKLTVDFSDPYFEAGQVIVVPLDSKIQKIDDLKPLKVGVLQGSTGDDMLQKLLGDSNANIKRFESSALAMKELEAGGVSAVVADKGAVVHYLSNNQVKGIRIVTDDNFPKEFFGIAVKKGDAALLGKINQGLAAIKADGTYDKLHAQYFDTVAK
ncbi:polar amino acid transport system substrate-binding protein [Collimonas sp. OK607]|uniref:basic amino acid ABC transporter substrate-binding protein n=1 Tax=Collimonas sp. OK607 TaxID=1798194 RepID=UPI0008F2860D|nr:basic amino acid ABC transporter substrate-binding protein [Collimonas sp. OK607]SFB37231.1 polar amino acid transport system substrate-binding protein [Collimonas sp. OK607]